MASETHGISEQELRALEVRVDELIRACAHLKEENKALRLRHDQLLSERAGLIEKSDLARSRVEAMISRLKTLESGT
jgi:cell division protein ZapB